MSSYLSSALRASDNICFHIALRKESRVYYTVIGDSFLSAIWKQLLSEARSAEDNYSYCTKKSPITVLLTINCRKRPLTTKYHIAVLYNRPINNDIGRQMVNNIWHGIEMGFSDWIREGHVTYNNYWCNVVESYWSWNKTLIELNRCVFILASNQCRIKQYIID